MAKSDRPIRAKRSNCIQRRIMLASRDLGENCFYEHMDEIMQIAEREKCETVMFALYTVDDQGGTINLTPKSIFGTTRKFPSTVILESGSMDKEVTYVEVFSRKIGKLSHRQFIRHFATSTESRVLKEKLITEFRQRNRHVSKDTALVICGESNAIRTLRSDRSCRGIDRPINDEFGFLNLLSKTKTKVVGNPWHTYCRRPEANWKKAALSRNKRLTVSVWNKWKAEIRGEARNPWVAYYDGASVTEMIREIPQPIRGRSDIRVAILSFQ